MCKNKEYIGQSLNAKRNYRYIDICFKSDIPHGVQPYTWALTRLGR